MHQHQRVVLPAVEQESDTLSLLDAVVSESTSLTISAIRQTKQRRFVLCRICLQEDCPLSHWVDE